VRCGGVEQVFAGSLKNVWLSVNKFFGEFVPSIQITGRLVLKTDSVFAEAY
jgi:hypothetical protein